MFMEVLDFLNFLLVNLGALIIVGLLDFFKYVLILILGRPFAFCCKVSLVMSIAPWFVIFGLESGV